jgi:hypothetical protein
VERSIGEMGHKICSRKAPFANLANLIYERELVKNLILYYPVLESGTDKLGANTVMTSTPHQQIKVLQRERANTQCEFSQHLHVICLWLQRDFDPELELHRWGKYSLPDGTTLRSKLSECWGKPPSRSAQYFEAQIAGAEPVFGEALAFYEILETQQVLIVYQPIFELQVTLGHWRGIWSDTVQVLPVSALIALVGILCHDTRVWILRKHPGLAVLNVEERGYVDIVHDSDGGDDNNDFL